MRGSKKAKTRKTQTERETITMKTKLTKTIMSSLAFTCALVCLVAVIAVGTSGRAGPAPDPQVCSVGMVNIGGTIIIDATGGVGTYTVAADCTGTLSITNGPKL